jgi:hypothetical protein
MHEARIENLEQRAGTILSATAIQTVCDYASELREKATSADFATKRFIVDILNVNVVMEQEGCGCLFADVSCEIATERLQVVLGTDLTF